MITNRRKFLRLPTDEPCQVTIDGTDLECRLVDQSINGAKIAGLDFLMVPHGKPVTIGHEKNTFKAVIRRVTRGDNNNLLIGVERVDEKKKDESDDEDAMLLNCYLRHEKNLMVCIPVSMEPDQRVRVQLWDGMQFPIAYSALVTMNREERYESLMNGSDLKTIGTLYGLEKNAMSRMAETIFNFEFGRLANCNVIKNYAYA